MDITTFGANTPKQSVKAGHQTPRQTMRTKKTNVYMAVAKFIEPATKTWYGQAALGATAVFLAIPVAALCATYTDPSLFPEAARHYASVATNSQFGQIFTGFGQSVIQQDSAMFYESLNNLASNPQLVAYLVGVKKMFNIAMADLTGDLGRNESKLSDGSPINLYRDALKLHDANNTFDKPYKRGVNISASWGMGVHKSIQGLRRTWLGRKITPDSNAKIHQGEIDLLHTLVFSKLMSERVPEINKINSHEMFKHPAFDFIFKNAETLSQALESNIKNFTGFSRSVFRSMSGFERDVLRIDPRLQGTNAEVARLDQFNKITGRVFADAYEEIEQRSSMKNVVSNINNELNILLENYPDGNIDTFQLDHIHNVLNIGSQSLQLFDEGHMPTIYAELYTRLSDIQSNVSQAIDQAQNQGLETVDVKTIPGISTWTNTLQKNSEHSAEQNVWEMLIPNTPYEVNVDGVAAKRLLEEVKILAKRENADKNPEDVTLEIGRRAVFDHMGRGARPKLNT